ncbi:MAG: hypothetical protein FH751_06065 [Firmicutes bacterium]|nr:hypothetical protein [Bacillota bacterium]
MILTLFKTELIKQKKGYIWLIVTIIPLGTMVAMFLDMYLRYHTYLYGLAQKNKITSWVILLKENHNILGWGMFLPFFVSIIATIIYYTEFENNSWKKHLSLPISKVEIYISKFFVILFFSLIMIILNSLGLLAVGKVIGFPEVFDYKLYANYILFQFIAILGVSAIHNLLSSYYENAIASVTIGFISMIFSKIVLLARPSMAKFSPYTYTYYANILNGESKAIVVYGGIISMVIFLFLGILSFKKRDIL